MFHRTEYKIEVKVDGEWIPMELVDPLIIPVLPRRYEVLQAAADSYRKPVRIVKIERATTVIETLHEEASR